MTLDITCPTCRRRFRADARHAGRVTACPACAAPIAITPDSPDTSATSAQPSLGQKPAYRPATVNVRNIKRATIGWSALTLGCVVAVIAASLWLAGLAESPSDRQRVIAALTDAGWRRVGGPPPVGEEPAHDASVWVLDAAAIETTAIVVAYPDKLTLDVAIEATPWSPGTAPYVAAVTAAVGPLSAVGPWSADNWLDWLAGHLTAAPSNATESAWLCTRDLAITATTTRLTLRSDSLLAAP